MLRKFLFLCGLILALSLSPNVIAQTKTAKLKVTSLKKGKVRLSRGAVKSVLDLSKDISGCIVVYDRSDPKVRMDTTDFTLVNSVVKAGKTYALLLAEINSGCNITGECGAATDWTLVWLKLNSNFRVEQKKAVVVQSCFWGDINIRDEEGELDIGVYPTFTLRRGILSLKFETNRYHTEQEYSLSTLTYNSSQPEKGLVVKTEKAARPKD
jgi:hypothetical protein